MVKALSRVRPTILHDAQGFDSGLGSKSCGVDDLNYLPAGSISIKGFWSELRVWVDERESRPHTHCQFGAGGWGV